MGQVEDRWLHSLSRRKTLAGLGGLLAGSPLLSAQQDPHGILALHKRVPGLDEMLTAFDFEPIFFANVPPATFDYTAHGDGSEFTVRRNREAFEWVDVVWVALRAGVWVRLAPWGCSAFLKFSRSNSFRRWHMPDDPPWLRWIVAREGRILDEHHQNH